MVYEKIQLPYTFDSLEPYIDAETVESVDKSVDKEESVETKSVDKNGSGSSKSASEEEETTLTVKTE